MEDVLLEILAELRTGALVDDARIAQVLARHNREAAAPVRAFAKKHVVPFYLNVKSNDPDRWASWNVDAGLEARLMATMRMKPRRTASGVATITVITKPWPCANDCLYCPNDVRMPKSYLHDEPACQRAERNYFDPYLQVSSRLQALQNMGHITDKVELIVLGGTWADYPRGYQIWFVQQLFAALDDTEETREATASLRREAYRHAGIECEADRLASIAEPWQRAIEGGTARYNECVRGLYGENPSWKEVSHWQDAKLDDLLREHRANEHADHRVVGLVIETRPDTVDAESLCLIRQLGATKVQMGIQSLDEHVLAANGRRTERETVERALDLARLFGFKVHTHFMVNLLEATPASDKADYARFMADTPYQPDEVKLYPCALVAGTGLQAHFEDGSWRPYTEEELIDVLVADMLATPGFTRISRMIRDISAGDIVAGNKKANLRQLAEEAARATGKPICEMRYRELNSADIDRESLMLDEIRYRTLSTREVFLQWVTPEHRIAGFLRLSLPDPRFVEAHPELPVSAGQAMIREVHVYGRVAGINHCVNGNHAGVGTQDDALPSQNGTLAGNGSLANAQHAGLGRSLVKRACEIAAAEGYAEINVISAVGTREYYRNLGFADGELYLTKRLG